MLQFSLVYMLSYSLMPSLDLFSLSLSLIYKQPCWIEISYLNPNSLENYPNALIYIRELICHYNSKGNNCVCKIGVSLSVFDYIFIKKNLKWWAN